MKRIAINSEIKRIAINPAMTAKQAIELILDIASDNWTAFELVSTGIGWYEYYGAIAYDRGRDFMYADWHPVVASLSDEQILGISDRFTVPVEYNGHEAVVEVQVDDLEDGTYKFTFDTIA